MKNVSINIEEYIYHLEWSEWMPHIKKFGFKCMEIAIGGNREPEKIDAFKKLIDKNGITVSSIHDYFHFFNPNDAEGIRAAQERLLKDLEYTRFLGADRLIWYTGSNDQFSGEVAVHELLDRLKPVLKRAEELKVTLLLETEFSKDGYDPAASVQLLKKLFMLADSPSLACNFDAANIYVAGEEPFPYAYEELKPWIRYVHIKDSRELVSGVHKLEDRKGYLQEGLKNATSCPLGEGAVNYTGLLHALKRDHYTGYLSLELHMKKEYQDETLQRSLEFLEKHWC